MADAAQKKRYRRATYVAGQDLPGINATLDAYQAGEAPLLPQGVTSISVVRHNKDAKSPPGVLFTPGHYVVISSNAGPPPDGWTEAQPGRGEGGGGGRAVVTWTANGGTQTETGLEERLFRSKDNTLTAKQWMTSDGQLRFVEVVRSVEETAGSERVPRKRTKPSSATATASAASSSAPATAPESLGAAADLEQGVGDIGSGDEAMLWEALLSDEDAEDVEYVEDLSNLEIVKEHVR
mmetsp:Transcript_6708/g.11972  ORF Transcript_6708/g.11972 Transcript_6708/m.11972 type:complete len:237 (+) Transcript_6708:140-850(+)